MFLGFGAQDLRVRVLGFQGLGFRVGVKVCESLKAFRVWSFGNPINPKPYQPHTLNPKRWRSSSAAFRDPAVRFYMPFMN